MIIFNINIKREQGFKTHRTYRTFVQCIYDGQTLWTEPMMLTRLFKDEAINDAMQFIGDTRQRAATQININDI